ncbi:hypothetical protein DFH07DRAFT_969711 [Mycena maculata]|uniref:Uncharacterized protein n=1 Tax=Mycena maculata TaxID=230809 RepID=A0AAD7HUN7_9AGAR|nr:hypothetical protein DFH07DRAFT_969711 [Mycena maculata]
MYLAPEDDETHPFSYAQIVGIFHADVVNTAPGANPKPEALEFLWIRRYRLDHTWRGGFKRKQLFHLEFLPDTDQNTFSFLNPDEVICGAHLIPAFASGTTEELLSSGSIGHLPRPRLTDDQDWRYYYVNMFVDHDMYMRYRGSGVGHYRVPIPPEDENPEPSPDSDKEDSEDPEVMDTAVSGAPPIPLVTPSATPELDDLEFPEHIDLHARPGSSLSQDSQESDDSNRSGSGDLGCEDEEVEEPDLGPEDGLGEIEEEVEQGYAVL